METIVSLQLKRVAYRLAERQIGMRWDQKVVQHLAQTGYDPIFGARPLKRLIQNEVVNLFATAILEGKIPTNSELLLIGEQQGDRFAISYELKNSSQTNF